MLLFMCLFMFLLLLTALMLCIELVTVSRIQFHLQECIRPLVHNRPAPVHVVRHQNARHCQPHLFPDMATLLIQPTLLCLCVERVPTLHLVLLLP